MHKYSSVLLNLIVHQYFKNLNCVFYLLENNYDAISQIVPVVVVNISTISELSSNAKDFEDTRKNLIDFNKYCQAIVIESNNPRIVFDYVEEHLMRNTSTIYKYNIRKYLFLVPNSKEMHRLLRSVYLEAVSDIVFITLNKSDCTRKRYEAVCMEEYDIGTHYFVGKIPRMRRFLDKWYSTNQSFLYNRTLYMDKINNMRGTILKISTYVLSPYTVLGNSLEHSYGVDVRLLVEYVTKHNFTPLTLNPDIDWGLPYGNKTQITGTVGQVVNGHADIAIGGLVIWPDIMFEVDFTRFYYASTIKCLVPLPGLLSEWKLPFHPVRPMLFVVLLLSFLTSTMILYVSSLIDMERKKYKSTTKGALLMDVTFNTLAIHVIQTTSLPKRYKFVTFLILLLSLYFGIMYNSDLASIITKPSLSPPIDTIEDIIKHKLKIGTTSIPGYANIVVYDEKERYRKFSKLLFEANETDLWNFMHNFKGMGLLIDKTLLGSFGVSNSVEKRVLSRFQIMREDILKMYIVSVMRSHSVFLPSFNKLAATIFESGLAYFWDQTALFRTSSVKIQKVLNIRNTYNKKAKDLKLIQIKGACCIWCGGLLLSLIIFLCELFLSKPKADIDVHVA